MAGMMLNDPYGLKKTAQPGIRPAVGQSPAMTTNQSLGSGGQIAPQNTPAPQSYTGSPMASAQTFGGGGSTLGGSSLGDRGINTGSSATSTGQWKTYWAAEEAKRATTQPPNTLGNLQLTGSQAVSGPGGLTTYQSQYGPMGGAGGGGGFGGTGGGGGGAGGAGGTGPTYLQQQQDAEAQRKHELAMQAARDAAEAARQQAALAGANAQQQQQAAAEAARQAADIAAQQALQNTGFTGQGGLQSSDLAAKAAQQAAAEKAAAALQASGFAGEAAQQQAGFANDAAALAERNRLGKEAEQRMMERYQQIVGGGGTPVDQPIGGMAADPAQDAIFNRAKDREGQIAASSLRGLRESLGARGMLGGGAEGAATAQLAGAAGSGLSDVNREQAIQQSIQAREVEKQRKDIELATRGQNLSLFGLMQQGGKVY